MASSGRNYILLTSDFKPRTGGIAEYLHNLWNEVAREVPVTVLTTVDNEGKGWDRAYDCQQIPPPPLRLLGSRFGDRLPPTRRINTALYYCRLRRYAQGIATLINNASNSHTRVFIGSWWGEVSHFWCDALKNAGIPYSLHAYGMEIVTSFSGNLSRWRHQDLSNAKSIFACSSGSAGLITEKLGLTVPVKAVTPGVSIAAEPPDTREKRQELRDNLALHDKRIILTVGRLVPRKGIDLVLKAVSVLREEFPDIRYIIAGEGPDKGRLANEAASLGIERHVDFLGEVAELTKLALYELCDVFVMPNRIMNGADWEGFGIVFLEAALAGKPSIGGNNGGVPDAIEDGVTGFLVDTDTDEHETTTAIRRLLLDDELRLGLGAAARDRAQRSFRWDTVGGKFRGMLD